MSLLVLVALSFSMSSLRADSEVPNSEKLSPALSIDSIRPSGMTVSWRVGWNDTSSQPNCTFEVDLCREPLGCYGVSSGIPWEERRAVLPFEAFVYHNVSVTTRCEFQDRPSTFSSGNVTVFTAFDPPEGINSRIISPHEVELSWEAANATSTLKVEDFKYRVQCEIGYKQVCFDTKFSGDPSVLLRHLEAFTDYSVGISACIGTYRCGNSTIHSFSTPAGRPSAPRSLKGFREEGIISISWLPPEHLEGFLDGYELGFCLANERDCPLNDDWHPVRRTQTSSTWRIGHQVTGVKLRAFNKRGARSLYSEDATAEVEDKKKTSKPPVALLVITCIAVLGAVIVGAFYQYKKWKFQKRDPGLIVAANLSNGNVELHIG